MFLKAPVAQLDRVLGYEPSGREFESLRARQFIMKKIKIITIILTILYTSNVYSYEIKGIGLLKCKEFNSASIDDKDIFLSWLAGYLSHAFENQDIKSSALNPGYDRTIIWIEYYCHKYPNSTFYDSAKNYIKEFYKK